MGQAAKIELSDIVGVKKKIDLTGNKSGLPDYPVNVFPETVVYWATELQRVYNIDAGYTLTSAIVAAGTAIGNKYIAQIKGTHAAPSNFFALLLGASGAGKTPAMKYATDVFIRYFIAKYKEHKLRADDHNEREAQAKAAGVEFTEKPPVFTDRHIFHDTTIEALYKHCENSINGCMYISDEYMVFFNDYISGSRYGNGNNRARTLSWLDCAPIIIDTKKEGTKVIENSHNSLLAGAQYDRLPEIIGFVSDGYTERFLYVFNTRPYKAYSYETVSDSVLYEYDNTIQKLIEIDFHYNQLGEVEPRKVPFSESAFNKYVEWSEQLADKVRESETQQAQTIYTKMQNFCPRIALVLQMLYYACNEDVNTHIGDKAINGAIQLMDYYIAASLKAHGEARQQDPTKKLTTQEYKVYSALPDEFKTSAGIEIAARFSMPERTAKRLFNKKELFVRAKHGEYEKLY